MTFLVITIFGADPDGTAPGLIDLFQLVMVEEDDTAAREIRRRQGGKEVVLRVLNQVDGGFADLREAKGQI
jgi:hypothetical protein